VLAFEVDPAGIPNVVIITAALVAALGVLWRKVVVPVRGWFRSFKAWMDRTETALTWVESQMKPNGGSTLVDKVNMLLEHDAERDTAGRRYGPELTNTETEEP
jgi:hypothetical protein